MPLIPEEDVDHLSASTETTVENQFCDFQFNKFLINISKLKRLERHFVGDNFYEEDHWTRAMFCLTLPIPFFPCGVGWVHCLSFISRQVKMASKELCMELGLCPGICGVQRLLVA